MGDSRKIYSKDLGIDLDKGSEEKNGLKSIIKKAKNKRDLAIKLQKFKGIGPVTTRIFLRDLKIVK